LYRSFADSELMRYWSRGPFGSEAELAEWLVPDSGWERGRSWAVTDGDDGQAIARLVSIDRGDGIAELGYLVVRERQGQGVARETLAGLIGYLFATEDWRRLIADIDPDNTASNRLVQSLGFTLEGRLRKIGTTHIGRRDSLVWGLLETEWRGTLAVG
jgi:RimJ/RimL family protein N-acetyltransferase